MHFHSNGRAALLTLHYLQFPTVLRAEFTGEPATFMTGICDHRVDPRKQMEPNRLTNERLRGDPSVGRFHPAGDRESKGIDQDVAFTAFDTLMAIEAASAATLGGFHRLTIHDHDTWASFAPAAIRTCS